MSEGPQRGQHFWTQSQGKQVLCAYGRKQEQVFLCPGRQRGQKALYLGQTSLHLGRAQSLFYLCFLPAAPWEWSEQVLTHPLGLAVHHQRVLRQQLLNPSRLAGCCSAHAHRRPGTSSQGTAGTGRRGCLETGPRTYSLHALSPTSCEAGGSGQGQLWGAPGRAGAEDKPPCPPCGRPVKWRCHPLPTSTAWWVAGLAPGTGMLYPLDGRGPRLQGTHCGRDSASAA